jgi:hypothetical protein
MKSIYFGNRDLEQLTEPERQAHYENICEAAGLNPALNLIRYRMMDDGSGTGKRHLILYATKAATDAIRGIQGINDLDMTESQVGTAYIVTTKVQNERGRTLFAKGSVDLEGKRGRALENAIALAQTRSSRRAALAISGLGLLDESELGDVITNPVSDAPTPLPPVKQPTAKVNSAIGKDVTAPTGLTLKAPPKVSTVSANNDRADTLAFQEAALETFTRGDEPTRLPNPAVGLKVANDNLAGPGLNRQGRVIEKPSVAPDAKVEFHIAIPPNVGTNAVVFPPDGVPAEGINVSVAEDVPKKTRKKRTPKVSEPVNESAVEETKTPIDKIDAALSLPVAELGSKATVTTLSMPNQEQIKGYVKRLTDLRETILPADGLIQSHGMGPNAKIRKFFSVVNNNTEDLSKLTVAQWESTFAYIDGILATGIRGELSKSINYNIGAIDEPAAAQ